MENIIFISVSEETIKNIVEEAVKEAITKSQTNVETEQKVVDLDGLLVARPYIGSRSTLYKKISKGLIPHSKQGKKLYFDLNEIDAWLMEHKVKSSAELKKDLADYNKNRKVR